ncbi:hypothetical protein EL09_22750 [Salmonella enterica subsp. enterica]|nr:hypothetical protein [Salmonella enterica subsp. enterica]
MENNKVGKFILKFWFYIIHIPVMLISLFFCSCMMIHWAPDFLMYFDSPWMLVGIALHVTIAVFVLPIYAEDTPYRKPITLKRLRTKLISKMELS